MGNKNMKLFGIPIGFFLLGILFLILGAKGEEVAVTFSRPAGALHLGKLQVAQLTPLHRFQ